VGIAKESADAILLERSLMAIEEGVMEGRKVFANTLKYVRMGASSNFGNMFSVIGASAWLPFVPMAPIQILTNNLLDDFSQVAIPTDEVDADQIAKPARRSGMGSAPASGAVFRAPAENSGRREFSRTCSTRSRAGDWPRGRVQPRPRAGVLPQLRRSG